MEARKCIESGQAICGIEFGSTRIKAVLTDADGRVLATGGHDWENSLVDGIWTYDLADAREGLRSCYRSLREEVEKLYGITPQRFAAMGISGMMHGYLPFDREGRQLSRFQTWRNTNTQAAADILTEKFRFNIPLRWSIAHLYQCILDREEHLKEVAQITTLAGYIHRLLTGRNIVGVGEASGMFPIDPATCDYDEKMTAAFDELTKPCGFQWKIRDILPEVRVAGAEAGELTPEGAALIDDSGSLMSGIPFCPPEGDGDTGVVSTNTITKRTASVSAGTSTFAMVVLEKPLTRVYREIDVMMTPDGSLLAQSHGNNGTTDLNAWVGLFSEYASLIGADADQGRTFETLYRRSLDGEPDAGGMVSYCFLAGENLAGVNDGRPLFARGAGSGMNLANFMRAHIYGSLAVVAMGLDIMKDDGVVIDRVLGQGGFFKTKEVGQRALAAAVASPVTVMDTAGEGGAWGMALLAAYMDAREKGDDRPLDVFLDEQIFAGMPGTTVVPEKEETEGFRKYMERFKKCMAVEKAAIEALD